MDTNQETGPLKGIRVADFGHHRAGPHCGVILARLGAEVIKVEPIGGEQLRGHGLHWAQENNSKKSITVDLRNPEGQRIARELAAKCDILIQNFRPGVMERLGLGAQTLLEINPRLIIANVSAFGAAGPHRLRPGFDGIMQALTGLMMLNGEEDGPPMKTHPPIVDRVAGLHAAIGCLAALVERSHSGRGQSMDVSLLGSAYTIADADLALAITQQKSPARAGNRAGGPPINNAFQVSDGWIYIATGGRENMWQAVCRLVNRPDWIGDPRFATKAGRIANADEIESAVQQFFLGKSKAEALALLGETGIPAAQVRTPIEAVTDKFPFESKIFVYADGAGNRVPVTGDVWKFSRSSVTVGGLPAAGEHTHQVLKDVLGYSDETVEELKTKGAVA